MINKDIVYIVCFILIIINCIIYNKPNKPNYITHPLFKLIFIVCLTIVAHYSLYIGVFLGITFLTINQ